MCKGTCSAILAARALLHLYGYLLTKQSRKQLRAEQHIRDLKAEIVRRDHLLYDANHILATLTLHLAKNQSVLPNVSEIGKI